MSWPTAAIDQVAPATVSRQNFVSTERVWHLTLDQIESNSNEVAAKHFAPASAAGTSTYVFDEGNVLYSKLRPYLNKVVAPDEPGVATTELVPLRPDPRIVDRHFLAYYLRSSTFLREASQRVAGAKMPRVKMDWLRAHEMPLPPLSEQRRIVEILDQADALRKLPRDADAKAARILPALFLKMFGNPATNPMGWPEAPLSMAIASIEPGWSARSELRPRQDWELGVLKVSAVTSGRFLPDENKAVTTLTDGRPLVVPRRGDLLFSRANTRELVAATCLVEKDHPKLFLSDKLWRITANASNANNVFLKFLLSNEFVRDTIRARASGSSGSMLNVSQQAVLGTAVPVPSTDLQNVFEKRAWAVMAVIRNAETASSRVDVLWTQIMGQAFSGQLTVKWREAHLEKLLKEMQEQARLLNLPIPESVE